MAEEQNGKLTPLGKIISLVLILGLIATGAIILLNKYRTQGEPNKKLVQPVEAADTSGVTTVKEYKFVPSAKLPEVKGTSAYQWDANNKVLRFTYNVWSGWLPVIMANRGTKPNPDSIFAKKYGFQVEMKLMDDPVAAQAAFAQGEVHTLWGTADMMVLSAPGLMRDSRTAPRIVQQIDWSNGGDGIVVRSHIKQVSDLKGKTVVYAQNSPSEYYLTSLLLSAGLQPSDIKTKYTATAFEAAAAFVNDKSIDACVSWAPDIYNIPAKDKNARILSSTADANKLIADVYAIRADFVRDHPEVVQGLVAGIFEGMDELKDAEKARQACGWMAEAFGMKTDDIIGMRNDAHLTNFAENAQFFLNAANPTNFERTWKGASYVYEQLGRIKMAAPFEQVMDFTFIKDLETKGTFANQKDESVVKFAPGSYKVNVEKKILTQTIRINFFPNSSNPFEPARNADGNPIAGKLYDPNVTGTLERVGQLSGQFARAVIMIEGHTDSSMKGRAPVQAVKDLSLSRAEAIKKALIEKYKFDPNKFIIEGAGWDKPADPNDPENHAMNRRVEISVYPPEEQ